MSLISPKDIKKEGDGRKDPTSFLPEEEMTYEIKVKTKKKKKKKKQEDPFKDIEKNSNPDITALDPDLVPTSGRPNIGGLGSTQVDARPPEVTIKAETIEVDLDFNDFIHNDYEPDHLDDSKPEPIVKLEDQNRDAVLLTFESVINESGHSIAPKAEPSAPTHNHYCKICHLVFKSTRTLIMHQKRKHKHFRNFFDHVCDNCGMSYEAKSSLAAHIRRKHGPNANKDDLVEKACELCALVFKGSARLRMHMRRKHGSYVESFTLACEDCGLTYDKMSSLIVHRRRKHSDKPAPKENQFFTCPFCTKIFNKRETYSRHMQRNHKVADDDDNKNTEADEIIKKSVVNEKSGEVTCSSCGLVFSSTMYLKLHMRRKHNALVNDFRLKCKLCNLSYDKVESLKRHVRRKHDIGTYCIACSTHFASRELYLKHSHAKMVQECNLCGLIFASPGGLAKHLRCKHKVASANTVYCHICNAGFYDKRQLKPHYMKVHLKVSYTCNTCNKSFKTRETYRRHRMFQHPVENLDQNVTQKCEKCPLSFANEFDLCKHINIEHPSSIVIKKEETDTIKNLFACTKCSDEYSTWEQLRLHFEQTHHLAEEIQCQKCGEMMPRGDLQKHMKTHEETEMNCKYCEFQTKSRISLTQHLLRHKNAETLHCDFNGCRYKSFYEDAMAKHKRRHVDLGVKLQCTSCPFQTMNKYILRYHEEAHATGKKRYMCDQCDYATILPANLVQHKYKHSSEKRFKCEVCPFATKYNTSLRFHVRKKHCDLPSLR